MSKNNKFLFDLHNFDVPEEPEEEIIEEEEIEVEPPPPTFSEEELEAAKAVSHAAGRMEGMNEEKAKREQVIADLLHQINDSFSNIHAAEIYREKQYEEEALRLALQIIELLAPSLQNRLGKETLRSALKKVLSAQSGHSEIRIEIHPDMATDIDTLIEGIWPDKDDMPRYKVVADSSLGKGACSLSWKDGGMVRDPSKTANDIKTSIEALLVDQVLTKPASSMNSPENNAIKNQDNDTMSADQPSDQKPSDQPGEPNDG